MAKRASKAGSSPSQASKLKGKIDTQRLALKRQYEAARKRLAELRSLDCSAFDELWELVDEIVSSDPPMYLGGGFASTKAFISRELPGESQRSVARNILVARSFSPEDEAKHGISFLEEVALYAKEVAGASEVPHAIDLDRLTLRLKDTAGRERRIKARQATIEDVRKARRGLKPGRPRKAAESPQVKALLAALAKHAALRKVSVRVAKNEASFGSIPLSALSVFGKTIAQVRIPTDVK